MTPPVSPGSTSGPSTTDVVDFASHQLLPDRLASEAAVPAAGSARSEGEISGRDSFTARADTLASHVESVKDTVALLVVGLYGQHAPHDLIRKVADAHLALMEAASIAINEDNRKAMA